MSVQKMVFKYRSYTPIPFLVLLLASASPTPLSLASGFTLMLLGEALRFRAVGYAGSATRTGVVGGSDLVTSGPFARVRNPLYIGNVLMYFGAAVAGNGWVPWLPLATVGYFIIQYRIIVSHEEDYLSENFGAGYEDFFNHVPRWIPRARKWKGASDHRFNLFMALRSERDTLIAFASVMIVIFSIWKFR